MALVIGKFGGVHPALHSRVPLATFRDGTVGFTEDGDDSEISSCKCMCLCVSTPLYTKIFSHESMHHRSCSNQRSRAAHTPRLHADFPYCLSNAACKYIFLSYFLVSYMSCLSYHNRQVNQSEQESLFPKKSTSATRRL